MLAGLLSHSDDENDEQQRLKGPAFNTCSPADRCEPAVRSLRPAASRPLEAPAALQLDSAAAPATQKRYDIFTAAAAAAELLT